MYVRTARNSRKCNSSSASCRVPNTASNYVLFEIGQTLAGEFLLMRADKWKGRVVDAEKPTWEFVTSEQQLGFPPSNNSSVRLSSFFFRLHSTHLTTSLRDQREDFIMTIKCWVKLMAKLFMPPAWSSGIVADWIKISKRDLLIELNSNFLWGDSKTNITMFFENIYLEKFEKLYFIHWQQSIDNKQCIFDC